MEPTSNMDVTERVIAIITYLAVDHSLHGVTEIAKGLHISKGTVYRILSNLTRLQWAVQDPKTRKYQLGSRALDVGFSMVSDSKIESVSLPYLYELCDATGETAMLSLRVGWERVYIHQIEGKYAVRVIVEMRERYPLWSGAAGTAMLAHLDRREIEEVISGLEKSGTQTTATGKVISIEELRKDLEEIRERGFAVSVGTRIAGTVAVAAPIFDSDHRVAGAISIGVPIHRFDKGTQKSYGKLVREAAGKISAQMGGVPPFN